MSYNTYSEYYRMYKYLWRFIPYGSGMWSPHGYASSSFYVMRIQRSAWNLMTTLSKQGYVSSR